MKKGKMVGLIAFLVGIIGAILIGLLSGLGLFALGGGLTMVLVFAGIGIGLFNISAKEKMPIMLIALLVGSGAGVFATLPYVGGIFDKIVQTLAVVLIPAGVTVAVLWAIDLAKK